jgi:hypothetical protein
MSEQQITIKFGIICDDVRREENGKFILIGVYGHDIIVPSLPANILVSVVYQFEAKETGSFETTFRISIDDEVQIESKGKFQVAAPGIGLAAVPNVVIPTAREGLLKFELQIGDSDFMPVTSIPLALQKRK